MSAKYVDVTELEFDTLLKIEKGWIKSTQGNEYVYSYTSKKNEDVVVKVFSSVSINNGIGKKCGGDAIRIVAVNTKTQRGILKAKRVHRTPNWEVRVKERVMETIEKIW